MLDRQLTAAQERWLGELYEDHSPAVQRLCWRMLGNSQDAADACHEVFLRAARISPAPLAGEGQGISPSPSGGGQGGGAQTRAWLLAVARNYCIDQIRRQKRFNTALTRMGSDSPPDLDPESSVVDRHTVDAIFKQLNERERTVLWQTAVERRSLAEIASRLHLNYMAAGQVVSRARKHASLLAAKVAAVFIGFRLITRRLTPSHLGGSSGLLVAVVVPVVALSVQSSSSTTQPRAQLAQPAAATHQGVATRAAGTSGKTNALSLPAGSALPVTLPSPSIGVPALPAASAVSGAAGSATNTIKQAIPPLPSPPALPTSPVPSPPVIK
jgi:RNA polymerase sigma factor (sigma-70 family)